MKRIHTILLSLMLCATGWSQKAFRPEASLGVNFGITSSKVSFQPVINQSSLLGVNGGLTFRYISENHFGLIAELNLSQRGWKEVLADSTLNYSHRLTYLEIPFLTHLYFGNGNFRYFINLGPKLAILLNDAETRNFPLTANSNVEYEKKIDNMIDYGICAGTGLEIKTKIGSFLLEGRYCYGLSDVFSNAKSQYFSRSSNQVVSANLTYLIRL